MHDAALRQVARVTCSHSIPYTREQGHHLRYLGAIHWGAILPEKQEGVPSRCDVLHSSQAANAQERAACKASHHQLHNEDAALTSKLRQWDIHPVSKHPSGQQAERILRKKSGTRVYRRCKDTIGGSYATAFIAALGEG